MDTKQQILEATRNVFSTKGLAKTTTKEIAREAGCSEGTLYNYFAHKEDLFLAVLEANITNRITLLDTENLGQQSVNSNLTQMLHAALRFCEQVVPLSAALFADPALLAHYRQLLTLHNRGPQFSYQFFEPYLKAEQKLGRLSPDLDLVAVGALLYGACLHYIFTKQFLGEEPLPISEQQFVQNLVQTILPGILAKPAESA